MREALERVSDLKRRAELCARQLDAYEEGGAVRLSLQQMQATLEGIKPGVDRAPALSALAGVERYLLELPVKHLRQAADRLLVESRWMVGGDRQVFGDSRVEDAIGRPEQLRGQERFDAFVGAVDRLDLHRLNSFRTRARQAFRMARARVGDLDKSIEDAGLKAAYQDLQKAQELFDRDTPQARLHYRNALGRLIRLGTPSSKPTKEFKGGFAGRFAAQAKQFLVVDGLEGRLRSICAAPGSGFAAIVQDSPTKGNNVFLKVFTVERGRLRERASVPVFPGATSVAPGGVHAAENSKSSLPVGDKNLVVFWVGGLNDSSDGAKLECFAVDQDYARADPPSYLQTRAGSLTLEERRPQDRPRPVMVLDLATGPDGVLCALSYYAVHVFIDGDWEFAIPLPSLYRESVPSPRRVAVLPNHRVAVARPAEDLLQLARGAPEGLWDVSLEKAWSYRIDQFQLSQGPRARPRSVDASGNPVALTSLGSYLLALEHKNGAAFRVLDSANFRSRRPISPSGRGVSLSFPLDVAVSGRLVFAMDGHPGAQGESKWVGYFRQRIVCFELED